MLPPEMRDGVRLTNLDEDLFAGAEVTKRQFIDYLDAVADRLIPVLRDRPLSVLRATGRGPFFMQKNLPNYTPDWVHTVDIWAETSQRTVSYALCNDRRTLLWFGNQRAVELHPTLGLAADVQRATDMVLDLDPPGGDNKDPVAAFRAAVTAATLVRAVLDDLGLSCAVKTSGAKGVHVFVPIHTSHDPHDVVAATRAVAQRAAALDPAVATTEFLKADRGSRVFVDSTRTGSGTIAAAYSPRARPGVPVSFPVEWAELDTVVPSDFTVLTAPVAMSGRPSWADATGEPQALPEELIAEGHAIAAPRTARSAAPGGHSRRSTSSKTSASPVSSKRRRV